MRLHVEEQGSGSRVAVLLHGSLGSSHSWWRVATLLAERGYLVLALDLPGHGLSPRDPRATIERAADAVIDTLDGQHVAVAIGHSLGGMVLAAAAPRLQPDLAVYVDSPFTTEPDPDADAAAYEHARRQRTEAWLRATRPHYSERDCQVEDQAAQRFDPVTAAAVAASSGAWPPAAGSIVVRAEPSHYVDPAQASTLQERGVQVRPIPGAAHSVWYSHFDAFVDALPEVFAR